MNIFFIILAKLVPLYFIVLAGYCIGRFSDVNRATIAKVLIYIVAPVIIFNGTFQAQLSTITLILPILFCIISCILCGSFYYLTKRTVLSDTEKNIITFASGNGNTGYFGIPVAIAIFGHEVVPLVVLMGLGVLLYESTLGIFIIAKGCSSTRDSWKMVLKLPNIYAGGAGLIANVLHIKLGDGYTTTIHHFLGCYTILGMLLIGLGLSSIRQFNFDGKFNAFMLTAKFLAWPALVLFVIQFINYCVPNFFSPLLIGVMLLIAIVPVAASTVIYTIFLGLPPEKPALAVAISTLVALVYIPVVMMVFQKYYLLF